MAMKKQVVIYTTLVVVIGIAVVAGLFATGSLKIGADTVPEGATDITGVLDSGKWNLVGNPCGDTHYMKDAFGGKYDFKVINVNDLVQGHAYWIRPADGHKPMWLVDESCDNTDTLTKDVEITTGKVMAIGNPFYSEIPWDNITVTAGSETKTLQEALDKEWVMLAFYNNEGDNYASSTDSAVLNSAYHVVRKSTGGCAIMPSLYEVGYALQPLQGFYIAAATKLGNDAAVTITFNSQFEKSSIPTTADEVTATCGPEE